MDLISWLPLWVGLRIPVRILGMSRRDTLDRHFSRGQALEFQVQVSISGWFMVGHSHSALQQLQA